MSIPQTRTKSGSDLEHEVMHRSCVDRKLVCLFLCVLVINVPNRSIWDHFLEVSVHHSRVVGTVLPTMAKCKAVAGYIVMD